MPSEAGIREEGRLTGGRWAETGGGQATSTRAMRGLRTTATPSRGAAPALAATEPTLLRAFMDAHTGEELRGGGAARPETAADDWEAEEPD
jgi:hypothetical protein